MKYYIANTATGTHEGPYDINQLRAMAISPATLVWNETMKDWTRAIDVPELNATLFGGAQDPTTTPTGGYTYPQNGGQPMMQPMMQPVQPKTWLVESILATIFCCVPLGIAAIVMASQVSSYYREGDLEKALHYSNLAKKLTLWSVVAWAVIIVIYIWAIMAGLFDYAQFIE